MDGGTSSLPYRSDHPGFHGTIKNSTQDFVVTEIDVHGLLVSSPCVLEPPEKVNNADIRENLQTEETPPSGVLSEADSGEAVSHSCFDLRVILSSSVNKTLEQFASTIQSFNQVQKNLEMSLGVFPDKHQRALVHRAVKYSYPFLMTLTSHEEILVREDPDFRELTHLVSVEDAEEFFRYKDAKVPGSTFSFLPDDIKEHRTSVHHFVSRKFGKLMETKSFTTQGRTAITVRLRERGRKRTAVDRDEQEIYTGEQKSSKRGSPVTAVLLMRIMCWVIGSH